LWGITLYNQFIVKSSNRGLRHFILVLFYVKLSVFNLTEGNKTLINPYEKVLRPYLTLINPYEKVIRPYKTLKNHYERVLRRNKTLTKAELKPKQAFLNLLHHLNALNNAIGNCFKENNAKKYQSLKIFESKS